MVAGKKGFTIQRKPEKLNVTVTMPQITDGTGPLSLAYSLYPLETPIRCDQVALLWKTSWQSPRLLHDLLDLYVFVIAWC